VQHPVAGAEPELARDDVPELVVQPVRAPSASKRAPSPVGVGSTGTSSAWTENGTVTLTTVRASALGG
jgi:hypothetical protein